MSTYHSSNKTVAKNTIFLYIRTLLIMVVSIYTSRVILSTLGITDFGIFNAVGGIVALLGFLKGSMSNAVQRFLSFEIGRGNEHGVALTFSSSVIAHVVLATFVVLAVECIAPWFLANKMTIPIERLNAAGWVLHCTVFITFISVINVPYYAMVIAKEKMNFYAYTGIIEAFAKLGIVYMVKIGSFDRLIFYSILLAVISLLLFILTFFYCRINFKETKLIRVTRFDTIKNICSFAGWNLIGEFAWAMTNQGVTVLLNVFCGPVVNAARGLANQVNGAVMHFVQNFQTALNPQIIKTYAALQKDEMINLVSRGSRLSFALLLCISLPLIIEMPFVLDLWLEEVPLYTVQFCRLLLICSLVMVVTNLFVQVIRATGNVRKYQFVTALILLTDFPLALVLLKCGAEPQYVVVVTIFIQIINGAIRMLFAKRQVGYPIVDFLKNDFARMIVLLLISSILPISIVFFFPSCWIRFLIICIVSILSVGVSSYYFVLTKYERTYVVSVIRKKIMRNNGQ